MKYGTLLPHCWIAIEASRDVTNATDWRMEIIAFSAQLRMGKNGMGDGGVNPARLPGAKNFVSLASNSTTRIRGRHVCL